MNRTVKKAVILAAGRGKRLGSLTDSCPKPMVPFCGAPVAAHIVRLLSKVGITEFLFVVGYRSDAIRSHFGLGEELGVHIEYVEQTVPDGTASALALGRDFAQGEAILMSYGDILTEPSHYAALISTYESQPCSAVIGMNPMDDPTAGAAVYRDGNRITKVVEKPPAGTAGTEWNLAGAYVFSPSVWPALENVEKSPRGEYELTDTIQRLIDGDEPVLSVEFRGFWSDVGTPEALSAAETAWRW